MTRAVLVWPADGDPSRVMRTARLLTDYCDRLHLTVAAIAQLSVAFDMLRNTDVDALVVPGALDLLPLGVHVAEDLSKRPMPVLRAVPDDVPVTRRRPLPLRGPFGD